MFGLHSSSAVTSSPAVTVLGLGVGLLLAALTPARVGAASEGAAQGSMTVSILSPASLPPGFVLNPGGTIPGNFTFPDAGNMGTGSFTGMGSAGCTPGGCTSPEPGVDIEYQLTNDLTCTADGLGSYGGLEDSFALFAANNSTGSSVTLELRFATSWSVSATADDPPLNESAEASIDLLWAVPTDFCIELTSCPTGSLSGGVAGNCPMGFLTSTVLILGTSEVNTNQGNATASGPLSNCDVTVVVLADASSGGDLSVTSSCIASSDTVVFADGFESGDVSAWAE